MVDDRFDPVAPTVPLGTTVVWVNKGRNWHSVASFDGSFESGQIKPGERFAHQFNVAGTFKYICKHHGMQGMLGTITVVARRASGRLRPGRDIGVGSDPFISFLPRRASAL